MRRAAVALASGLLGCYQPLPPEGVACTTQLDCPTGLRCDRGICRTDPLDGSTPDAPDDIDAPDPGVACPPPVALPAFAAPAISVELSSTLPDGTPSLTADRLEVYFKSRRAGGAGGHDIWRSTRMAIGSAWTTPASVAELNSASEDTSPEIAPDGLTIWFTSNRAGGLGGKDFWTATRQTRTSAFSAPVTIPELGSAGLDEGLFVQPSGLIAYLHSDRLNPGVGAIFRATRASTSAAWSTPVAVAGAFDPAIDNQNVWLTADDCTMYFNAVATPQGGDLYIARRAVQGGPFGTPVAITELNAAVGFDADPWLSPDERYIMFVSDRNAATGFDIYEAAR